MRNAFRRHFPPPVLRLTATAAMAVALNACAFFASPKGIRAPERWLPADTAAFGRVHDVNVFRASWAKTSAAEAWSEPGPSLWLQDRFRPALAETAESLGAPGALNLLPLLDGPVSFAAWPTKPSADPSPPFALFAFLHFGENAPAARAVVAEWRRTPAPENVTSLVQMHAVAPRAGVHLCSAWIDDGLILASSPTELDRLLARRLASPRGLDGALAASALARRLRSSERAGDAVFFSLDAQKALAPSAAVLDRASGARDMTDVLRRSLGLHELESLSFAMRIRDDGFLHRTEVQTAPQPEGLLFLTDRSLALRSPGWIREGADEFTAMRLRPPADLHRDVAEALNALNPAFGGVLRAFETRAQGFVGVAPHEFLETLGSEIAFLRTTVDARPAWAVLWEVRKATALEETMDKLTGFFAANPQRMSYRGYPYTRRTMVGLPPRAWYSAQIEGFLAVTNSEAWIKRFIDEREALPEDFNLKNPLGDHSILKRLEDPFSAKATPHEAVVVERSLADTAKALREMDATLPLLLQSLEMRLKGFDLPTPPPAFMESLPPFSPFAEYAGKTVGRTWSTPEITTSESASSLTPLASPFAAWLLTGVLETAFGAAE